MPPRLVPRPALLAVLVAGLVASSPAAASAGEEGLPGTIALRGKTISVTWSDGDTLQFKGGIYKNKSARLVGYNTLESYGPVHRWGTWSGSELHTIAKDAQVAAAQGHWHCSTQGKKDSYKRILLDCPDARRELVAKGLAHVFAYSGEPDPGDMDAQREARIERRGMWAKGRPEHVVTSAGADDDGQVFLRTVSTRTGKTLIRHQRADVAPCEEVCQLPMLTGSCLMFVPYRIRYKEPWSCPEIPAGTLESPY